MDVVTRDGWVGVCLARLPECSQVRKYVRPARRASVSDKAPMSAAERHQPHCALGFRFNSANPSDAVQQDIRAQHDNVSTLGIYA